MLQVQLANAQNWQSFYTTSATAPVISGKRVLSPIQEIIIPVLATKNILAVLVTSARAEETWHYAGVLKVKVSTGLTLGGNYDVSASRHQKLYLNENHLVFLPTYAAQYSLSFLPPSWMRDISLYIWEYIGPQADSTEVLVDQSLASLGRIESKLGIQSILPD